MRTAEYLMQILSDAFAPDEVEKDAELA